MMATAQSGSKQKTVPSILLGLFTSLLLFFYGASGCQSTGAAPATLPTPQPAITVAATPGFFGPETTNSVDAPNRQLLLWAPASLARLFDSESNQTLVTVNEQFERSHQAVHVDVQIRDESGEASLLNYLRSAQRVAPTILPDIVLIDTQSLWQIADLELLHAFDWQQLTHDDQFYDFAEAAVTYQEQKVGIPYLAEVTHMVAKTEQMSTMPLTWDEVFTTDQPLYFVGGKSDSFNNFAYFQYLGAGGTTSGEILDGDALLALFAFLAEIRQRQLISDTVTEIVDVETVWNMLMNAETGVAETSTSVIFKHWDAVSNGIVQYGPLLSRSGNAPAATRVWAFVMITNDPRQQELCVEWLRTLLAPDVHSQWSRVATLVPTQPAAFDLWRNPSDYYGFIQQQLSAAFAFPSSRRFVDVSRRLQYAQELVLREEMTPEEAVIFVQATP